MDSLYYTIYICQTTIHKCMCYSRMKSRPFKRRPSTLIQHILLTYDPWTINIYNYNISKVSFSQIPSIFNLKQDCRIVTCFLNYSFNWSSYLLLPPPIRPTVHAELMDLLKALANMSGTFLPAYVEHDQLPKHQYDHH